MWPFLGDPVWGSKPQTCKAPMADPLISGHTKYKQMLIKKGTVGFYKRLLLVINVVLLYQNENSL
jgi:hypothetical protein